MFFSLVRNLVKDDFYLNFLDMIFRFSLVMLLFCSCVLTAQNKEVRTQPSDVTVFLQSAKVTEIAKVSLVEGKNMIKVIGLPNAVDDNSYQVGLSHQALLLSVTPSTNFLKSNEYTVEEQKLLDKKKNLKTDQKFLQAEINTLNGELTLIEQNQKIGNNESGWSAEQLSTLATYYTKRTLAIRQSLVRKSIEMENLNSKLHDIEQQIKESVKDKNVNRKEVLLEVQSSKALTSTLKITYVINAARWQPFYDIRAKSTKEPVDIITKGKIYQNSGKDWKNVNLSVSTYLPRANQNRPILNPFYVRESVGNVLLEQVNARDLQSYSNSLMLREESDALEDVAVTQVLGQQLNVLYAVNGQQNVSTNANGQTFILDKQSAEAEYVHHSVPKLTEDVFLLANIKDWQSLNLLLAEANIYFQDNYLGKTTINPNTTLSEFPISLGVDERIVVNRRLLDNLRSTKLLSSKKVDNYSYEIKVRNNSKEAITLEILDQIPISQNSKIEVLNVESNEGDLDKNTGSILWKKDILSGSGNTITFSYQLKYPKELQLQFY